MKKVIIAAVVATVFGLVGCADKDVEVKSSAVTSCAKAKCKCKNCRCKAGKFGVEQTAYDTAK